jgi:hypothetical protein
MRCHRLRWRAPRLAAPKPGAPGTLIRDTAIPIAASAAGQAFIRAGLLVGACLGAACAHAQDATWLLNPGSGDWDTAANWSSATTPTGTAIFGSSNVTSLTFSAPFTSVGAIRLNAGAPAYSFDLAGHSLFITGSGIVNNSSFAPGFLNPSVLLFNNASTAGNATITTNDGTIVFGIVAFNDTSTAATSKINNNTFGGVQFNNASTAGNATILNNGGITGFSNASTAGQRNDRQQHFWDDNFFGREHRG